MVPRLAAAAVLIAQAGCDLVFGVPSPVLGDAAVDSPPELVAHYRFDSTNRTIVDETGEHDGEAIAGITFPAGQAGNAIGFPATMPTPHVVVPDSTAWDLAVGAIELWVRTTNTTDQLGILSRDGIGDLDGHFALVQERDQFFAVRFQIARTDGDGYLCSNQAPIPDTWMHLVINLGAPSAELWVDGVLGTRTDTFSLLGGTATCNNAGVRGLDGNDSPWVFGALNSTSEPGTVSDITMPFAGGAIDELIIWRTRRELASQRFSRRR